MNAPEYLTTTEAADRLRVSRKTLEKLVAAGEIESTRVGVNRIAIRPEWLDAYANGRRVSLVDISERLTRVEVRLDSLDARLDKIEAGIAVVSRHLSALTRVAV